MADLSSLVNSMRGQSQQPDQPSGSDNELLAQAILGFAPILLGSALGGARGGAVGAEAGLGSLQTLQKSKAAEEEKKKRETETQLKLSEEKRREAREERLASAEERRLATQEAAERRSMFVALEKLGLDKQELAQRQKEFQAKAEQEKKLPSAQFQAGTFTRRMEQAESVFDQLEKQGYDRASLKEGVMSALPERIKSSALKAQTQAERNFVNAVLRKESGAAISPAEFANAEAQYFPRAGDTPEVIAQKKMNRLQVQAGLRAEAGEALKKIPLVEMRMPSVAKQPGLIPEAQAAPLAPDFSKMSVDDLKKYLGR